MIKSKNELKFYIFADRMMNRGQFNFSLKQRIKNLIVPDRILQFLKALRKQEYYNANNKTVLGYINLLKLKKLGTLLNFSISVGVFGYGLVIPHYGTIVVGEGNIVGNYAVLHTSTCITAGNKIIGEGLYLSTGAVVMKDVEFADGISIGANSLVNCSFKEPNCLVVGQPAKKIKHSSVWYLRDGDVYKNRVEQCELLKNRMGISN